MRCYRRPSEPQQDEGAAADGVAFRTLPAWVIEAQGKLTLALNPSDGDTMTIGPKTYTFEEVDEGEGLTDTDGHIRIDRTVEATRSNVVAAINRTGAAGTQYAAATTRQGADPSAPPTAAQGVLDIRDNNVTSTSRGSAWPTRCGRTSCPPSRRAG